MAMIQDDAKVAVDSAIGANSRWFNYTRQSIPRSIVDNYLCMAVTRIADTGEIPSTYTVNSTATGVVNAMVWWQPTNPNAAAFGITQAGSNFRSRVFQAFSQFRCRCMKITLVPQMGMPETNQFRLDSYLMFPPAPLDRQTGNLYNPNTATEYPRYTDLREGDDFIVKLGSKKSQALVASFVPQVQQNFYEPENAGSYTCMQMPWTDTNDTSEGFAMRIPWFGWHVPDTSPVINQMAVYQIIVEAIYEFRNPNNTL